MTQAADQTQAAQTGDDFEPKIVAFCCHYCAYTAADTAGASRMQYPPNESRFQESGRNRYAFKFLRYRGKIRCTPVTFVACYFRNHAVLNHE